MHWLLAIFVITSGCATVQPWQRGVLAQRQMLWAPQPERAAARGHVFAVREGAQGGAGDAQGACGCD